MKPVFKRAFYRGNKLIVECDRFQANQYWIAPGEDAVVANDFHWIFLPIANPKAVERILNQFPENPYDDYYEIKNPFSFFTDRHSQYAEQIIDIESGILFSGSDDAFAISSFFLSIYNMVTNVDESKRTFRVAIHATRNNCLEIFEKCQIYFNTFSLSVSWRDKIHSNRRVGFPVYIDLVESSDEFVGSSYDCVLLYKPDSITMSNFSFLNLMDNDSSSKLSKHRFVLTDTIETVMTNRAMFGRIFDWIGIPTTNTWLLHDPSLFGEILFPDLLKCRIHEFSVFPEHYIPSSKEICEIVKYGNTLDHYLVFPYLTVSSLLEYAEIGKYFLRSGFTTRGKIEQIQSLSNIVLCDDPFSGNDLNDIEAWISGWKYMINHYKNRFDMKMIWETQIKVINNKVLENFERTT